MQQPSIDDFQEDLRFPICSREALLALALFVATAAVSVTVIYATTAGRQPEQYGFTLGLPAFIFWGIIVVYIVFIFAAELMLRYLYTDIPLDANVPSVDVERPFSS